jgi:uncharacterized protein YbjQ (UPF0145 family)
MKDKEIANMYGLDIGEFREFLKGQPQYTQNLWGAFEVLNSDVNALIPEFNQYKAIKTERLAQEATQRAERQRQEAALLEKRQEEEARRIAYKPVALANMLITSGFNFDGYTITKYSGYISGDDAVQIDRGTQGIFSRATDVSASLMESLVKIRRKALAELKEAAYALGCNAVIGVDFDYLILDPQTSGGYFKDHRTEYLPYVFGVTANGNAVIIEKNKPVGVA